MKKLYCVAVLGLLFVSGQALAGLVIVQPTSLDASINVGLQEPLANTINGAGLSTDLNTGDDVPDNLPTEAWQSWEEGKGTRWRSDQLGNSTGYITYVLGGAYDLEDVIFWNYGENNGNTDRGIASVTASFSTDGVTFAGSNTLNFAEADSDPTAGETVNFQDEGVAASDLSGVTHVKFTDFVNHSTDDDEWHGYGEIRFDGIPEPVTIGMLGLGAIVSVLIRRKVMG